jgi:hypothetical protein
LQLNYKVRVKNAHIKAVLFRTACLWPWISHFENMFEPTTHRVGMKTSAENEWRKRELWSQQDDYVSSKLVYTVSSFIGKQNQSVELSETRGFTISKRKRYLPNGPVVSAENCHSSEINCCNFTKTYCRGLNLKQNKVAGSAVSCQSGPTLWSLGVYVLQSLRTHSSQRIIILVGRLYKSGQPTHTLSYKSYIFHCVFFIPRQDIQSYQ